MKMNKKQYLRYRIWVYLSVMILIAIGGYLDYQNWINPLGLRPEVNPKQHDGSQEFQVIVPFESSITREDGTPVFIPETSSDIVIDDTLSQEEQAIFDELKQKDPYEGQILVD